MARNKKTSKLKEPIRLRMKDLSNGNKSLYLDIYRDGKRSYEYLKMYIIPETDDDARKRNQATLVAANAIKSQRIIAMTNGEAGIKKADDKPKVLLADWLQTYKERQKKRGRKDEAQINTAIRILTEMGCENMTKDDVDKKFCQNFIDHLRDGYKTRKGQSICSMFLLSCIERCAKCCCKRGVAKDKSIYKTWQLGQTESPRKQT